MATVRIYPDEDLTPLQWGKFPEDAPNHYGNVDEDIDDPGADWADYLRTTFPDIEDKLGFTSATSEGVTNIDTIQTIRVILAHWGIQTKGVYPSLEIKIYTQGQLRDTTTVEIDSTQTESEGYYDIDVSALSLVQDDADALTYLVKAVPRGEGDIELDPYESP